MNQCELDATKIKVNEKKPESDDPEKEKENQQFIEMMPWDQEACKERMVSINQAIKDVSGMLSRPRGCADANTPFV